MKPFLFRDPGVGGKGKQQGVCVILRAKTNGGCGYICVREGRVRVELFHFVFTFNYHTNGLWNPLAAGGL